MNTILEPGDNLLVVHRRLYDGDQSRFFVGRVEAYEHGLAKVCGHSFARDSVDGNLCRKDEIQTKIFAIGSGTLITYFIPADVDVDQLQMETLDAGLTLTDGKRFAMNISEWVHHL
jgi:hypothetical protein